MVEYLKTNEEIKKLIAEKKILVIGGYYDLNSGVVQLVTDCR